jgi:hypothetical protein
MDADGEIRPGRNNKDFSQQSYGAHFAEVGVDEDTGEVRLHRMLGVFTAGRILNAKTARSQAIGGMVFGVGAALHEEMTLDPRFGYFVNHDLAEYHVPVHADIPAIEAIFLAELDDKSNPLKSKGIGELGICGAGASIANAVYNACGVRVHFDHVDKLLARLRWSKYDRQRQRPSGAVVPGHDRNYRSRHPGDLSCGLARRCRRTGSDALISCHRLSAEHQRHNDCDNSTAARAALVGRAG